VPVLDTACKVKLGLPSWAVCRLCGSRLNRISTCALKQRFTLKKRPRVRAGRSQRATVARRDRCGDCRKVQDGVWKGL